MSTGSDSSVIRKKAQSGREDFDARAMSWSKAVRLSLERISDRLFGLQMAVRTVEQVGAVLSDLRELASGDRLIMLLDAYGVLDGEEAQGNVPCRGAVILDRSFVQTLVEVQTRGHVTQAELETRVFTHTDAAVTAQLIDPVLSSVDDMMLETPQSAMPLRLRFGDKVEDARALLLALDAPDYAVFHISLDIENGARNSEMILIIPDEMLHPPAPVPDTDEPETGAFDIGGMALSAPIHLNAVVARLSMPLSQVYALKSGDTLPVMRNNLMQTELVGSKGFVLGKVSLGQMNGFRAVRLGPGEPEDAPALVSNEDDGPLAEQMTDETVLSESVPRLSEGQSDTDGALNGIEDDLAQLAPIPGGPDLDDLTDLTDLGDISDLSDLGDLGDLGDLSDLENLGDLADLASPSPIDEKPDTPKAPIV